MLSRHCSKPYGSLWYFDVFCRQVAISIYVHQFSASDLARSFERFKAPIKDFMLWRETFTANAFAAPRWWLNMRQQLASPKLQVVWVFHSNLLWVCLVCNFDSPLSGSNIFCFQTAQLSLLQVWMWAARGKSSAPKVALVGWVDSYEATLCPCNILAGHGKILYVPAGQCAFRSFKEAYEGQGVSNAGILDFEVYHWTHACWTHLWAQVSLEASGTKVAENLAHSGRLAMTFGCR